MTSSEAYVVTYKIEVEDVEGRVLLINEFYRGEREECERIGRNSGGVAVVEGKRVNRCEVVVGPVSQWEAFLAAN